MVCFLASCAFSTQQSSDVWLQEYAEVTRYIDLEYETAFVHSIITHPSFATGSLADLETSYYFIVEEDVLVQVTREQDGGIKTFVSAKDVRLESAHLSAEEMLSFVQCSPSAVVELVDQRHNLINDTNERYTTISLVIGDYVQEIFGIPAVWVVMNEIEVPEAEGRQIIRIIVDPQGCRLLKRIDDINAPLGG
jgi:hypothetical protein